MTVLAIVIVVVVLLVLLIIPAAVKIVKQYENGVLFRLGRVIGERPQGCASSSRSSTCCTGYRCAS